MDNFELVGPNGTDINNDFLKAYRDSLKAQYDANVAALNQNKRNNETAIMSGANRQGLMYSNFPQRAKIQNEANYLSNMANLNTTYQTGLDKLRGNALDTYNKIKDLEDQIKDLNDYAANPTTSNKTDLSSLADVLNKMLGNQKSGDRTNESDDNSSNSNSVTGQSNEYSDAGWSSSSWDEEVKNSNGKYSDWAIFPDWLERGWQTGQWYFGNQKGKG